MNILVTGANGFVGHHLVKELAENNIHVIAAGGPESIIPDSTASYTSDYVGLDLTQKDAVEKLAKYDVDGIIHLAGLAAVGPSFDNPQKYINTNSAMVTNLCEHYVKAARRPRVLLVSSGAIYDSFQDMPITENSLLGFNSPYAVSKVLNENQAAYYRKRGLDVVVARPFNHVGPGQLPGFLVPDLIQQLQAAKENGKPLKVGNLATKRDYTDVRDVASAYRLLISTPILHATVYNVCSGVSRAGSDILVALQKLIGAEGIAVEVDQSKIRPNDPMDIYGDARQLQEDTGWKQQYSFEQTLVDIIKASQK
jgi:GDP-4-dehydro-6-deoxy-D-mannose reductase